MSKARKVARKGLQPNRLIPLLIALAAIALLYIALLPILRHMQAETERINRELQRRDTAVSQPVPPADALDAARAAVAKSPDDPHANLTLAGALVAAGKPDEALIYARKSALREPGNVPVQLALADIYERLRRHYEAMETYRAMLKLSPATVEAANRLSWLYISYGWTLDARTLLEPAAKANPDDPHLAVELALTYLQTHDFERCEQILLKIRRDHPAELELWNPLVDLYMKRKLYPQAIAVLQDSLKLRPGDPVLTDSLAEALFESGDVSGAQSSWQSVLSGSPNDVPAHYGLAECYRKLGQTVEAVRELETAMRLDPGYKESKLMLGQLYLRTNRADEGGKLLREYQEEQDKSREYARTSLLLASKPNDPAAHFEMARYYAASGKPERAIVEIHRALELNPHLDDARKMLVGLEHPSP
ncbi:MAG TPA: tetratricopeptide repeat protein [Chthonomonadaceae bacterium]|nr:tetratricopeptide repeat protein [Chthonomonadaceae bacterium]